AHRVQALAAHQALQAGVLRAHLGAGLDPARFLLDGDGAVADLKPKQLAAFGIWGDGRHFESPCAKEIPLIPVITSLRARRTIPSRPRPARTPRKRRPRGAARPAARPPRP